MHCWPLCLGLLVLVPAYARAATPAVSTSADEKVLREAKVGTDAPALLDWFRRRGLTAEQRRQLGLLIPRLGSEDFTTRQDASTALVALGPGAVPHLRRALSSPDEEIKDRLRQAIASLEPGSRPAVAAAAARLLRARGPTGAVAVLLGYLPEADDEGVEDEVLTGLALLGVRDGKLVAPLPDALNDAEPVRRAAAALVAARAGLAEHRPVVQRLLDGPSPLVRLRAAQGLLARRDRAALLTLAALTGEAAPVSTQADELLASLAGPRAPRPVVGDGPADRRRRRAAWESWARGQGGLALARADVDLPPLNPTCRAASTARRVLGAIKSGDHTALRDLCEAPFLFLDERVIERQAEVPKMLGALAQTAGEPYTEQQPSAIRFTGPPLSGKPVHRAFFARFKKGELRGVQLVYQPISNPGPRPGTMVQVPVAPLTLWLRLTDAPRVVALEMGP